MVVAQYGSCRCGNDEITSLAMDSYIIEKGEPFYNNCTHIPSSMISSCPHIPSSMPSNCLPSSMPRNCPHIPSSMPPSNYTHPKFNAQQLPTLSMFPIKAELDLTCVTKVRFYHEIYLGPMRNWTTEPSSHQSKWNIYPLKSCRSRARKAKF
jgi:hypothetical protein